MLSWQLQDLQRSMDSQESVGLFVSAFRERFSGSISLENLAEAVEDYENIVRKLEKIAAYAFLQLQTKLNDQKAIEYYQQVSEWLASIQSKLVFFEVELLKMDLESIQKELKNNKFLPWIENCFRYSPHMLSRDAEEVLALKQNTSSSSWLRMYDEILSMATFEMDDSKGKTLPEIIEIANHSDDPIEREKASKSLGKGLEKYSFYIKTIYNNIMLDWAIDSDLRRYEYPESMRHVSNNIDKSSVDNLRNAVIDGYKETAQKYYKIKAKLLGKEKIQYWDRNATIRKSQFFDRKFSYEEAVDITLTSYRLFSPEFAQIAQMFVEKSWIDVMPAVGKTSGAFSHHGSVEVHPYILLNFFGKVRDVSTLAHELGHGIHQTLASKNGALLAETPITLSEVASLFGEKLVFEKLLQTTQNDLEKIDLICSRLDDTMNSVVRQIAFFEFEREAHTLRKQKELSIEDLSVLWMRKQKECLGECVVLDDCLRNYWCYISHFFQSPFYVYAYSFGEILVNALYDSYQNSPNKSDFVAKYTDMLSKGGIERYDLAMTAFGLDVTKPDFWQKGVEVIRQQVNDLEALCGRYLC